MVKFGSNLGLILRKEKKKTKRKEEREEGREEEHRINITGVKNTFLEALKVWLTSTKKQAYGLH